MGKAPRGSLSATRPDDMAAVAMRAAIERVRGLQGEDIDDIYIGCAMPEAEQGMNVARVAAFRAGIPYSVPAMTLNRFCSSGLQSIAFAADRIASGAAHCILAGGTESMSMIPMGGHKISPNPRLIEADPEDIARRRNADRTRERDSKTVDEARTDLEWSRYMASANAVLAGAPIQIVLNPDGHQRRAAEDLLALIQKRTLP